MEMQPGMTVQAKAGRDKDRFFMILKVEDGYAYIADGKTRTVEKPKKKKLIHLAATKLIKDIEGVTNRQLKEYLAWANGKEML